MRTRHALVAVALCAALAGEPCPGAQIDGKTVLARLRDSDRAALGNVTISTHVRHPLPRSPNLDSEPISKHVTVTAQGHVWAVESVLDPNMKLPKYRPPGSDRTAWQGYGPQNELYLWRPMQHVGLDEDDFRGLHRLSRQYKVYPDGRVEQRDTTPTVFLRTRKEEFESGEVYIPVLSTGRGFSLLLDEITAVHEQKDGLLRCDAIGKYPDGKPCNWELVVDPQAGYMVRSARCETRRTGYVLAVLSNEGTLWFENGALPEKARFTFAPDRYGTTADGAFLVTFKGMQPRADGELIAKARQLLRQEFPKGAEILDYRRNPRQPLHYVVGEAPVSESTLARIFDRRIADMDVLEGSPIAEPASVPASRQPGASSLGQPASTVLSDRSPAFAHWYWVAIAIGVAVAGGLVGVAWWRRSRRGTARSADIT